MAGIGKRIHVNTVISGITWFDYQVRWLAQRADSVLHGLPNSVDETLDLGTTPMTKNGTFRGVMKPDLHGECPMILPILPRHTSVYDTNVRRRPLNRPGIVGGSNA